MIAKENVIKRKALKTEEENCSFRVIEIESKTNLHTRKIILALLKLSWYKPRELKKGLLLFLLGYLEP